MQLVLSDNCDSIHITLISRTVIRYNHRDYPNEFLASCTKLIIVTVSTQTKQSFTVLKSQTFTILCKFCLMLNNVYMLIGNFDIHTVITLLWIYFSQY